MKKIFYTLFIGICLYVMFVLYMANAYKFYNKTSGLIKPGEWSWYGDVGTRIICNDDLNISSKKCVLELFSLKDGLTLKVFPIKNDVPTTVSSGGKTYTIEQWNGSFSKLSAKENK
jgi:hypothetical protein